jgi:hypothetical protein
MNLNSLLKNRFVVIGLCLVAIGYMYFNVISPYLPKNNGAQKKFALQLAKRGAASGDQTISRSAIERALVSDSLKHTALKSIGWTRQGTRDPFKNEITHLSKQDHSQGLVVFHEKPLPAMAAKERMHLMEKSASEPRRAVLEAIAKGPRGNIALVDSRVVNNGDTCALGIVVKIGPDFVIFKSIKEKQIFTLHLSRTKNDD